MRPRVGGRGAGRMEARARAGGPEEGVTSRRQRRHLGRRECLGEGREEDSETVKTGDPHSGQLEAVRGQLRKREGGQLHGWVLRDRDWDRIGRTLKLSSSHTKTTVVWRQPTASRPSKITFFGFLENTSFSLI